MKGGNSIPKGTEKEELDFEYRGKVGKTEYLRGSNLHPSGLRIEVL